MSYAYSYGFDSNRFDKYETIQSDVEDMYIEDVEEETEDEDIFGFSKSIELDHLDDEQLEEIATMLGIK
jgi:hypothetical protein